MSKSPKRLKNPADKYQKSKLSIFASFYKPHLNLFVLDMTCAFFVAAIDVAYPMITRFALNNLLPNKQFSEFFWLMAMLVLFYVIRSGLHYIITYWGHQLGVYIEAGMRSDLFNHLQRLSFKFYDQNRTGQIMSRMTTDLFDITELTHHCPEDIFISAVTIIGAFIVLFNINWILSLCLIALAPLALLATMAQRSKMAKASRKVKESMATINAAVESGVSGARVAKAFVNEQHEVEKMESGNTLLKIARMTYYRTMAMFQSQIEFFASFFSVFVIIIGGVLLINDMISIVDLLVFSLYIGTFIQPIRKLTSLTVEQIANGLAGFDRFLEIMRIKPDITDSPTAKPIENVKGEVEYRNISFAYNSQTQVLKNVNLKIAPGKTVAIVGPSGGGKSTLCHLLPRFYEITEGEILLDGKNIKDITIESLRKNIGIVSQEVFLFAGTIKDNIEYGRIGATDEEIVAAAKKAKIYDMIAELPDGLETQVGERGVRLSGGQKQRISIARIFLKNPPVLILDEATSALDTVTEKQIQASFAELSVGRTTMIIAHRLSTIVGADEIIYIDEQGIREQGTHEQLLAKCGFYAKLFKMQFEETTV